MADEAVVFVSFCFFFPAVIKLVIFVMLSDESVVSDEYVLLRLLLNS